jgi:hypothetical protein
MRSPDAPPGLDIDEDFEFERKEWHRQRIALVFLSLVLAAALAGLIGSGPLSHAIAGEPGGVLWVEYERFARLSALQELRVHVRPGPSDDGLVVLWLRRDFVERHQVPRVTPPPVAVDARTDRFEYTFRAPDSHATIAVTFDLEAADWGVATAEIGIAGGPTVSFRQLVYP